MKTMAKQVVLVVGLVLAVFGSGCGAAVTSNPSANLLVRQEKASFVVVGQGAVEGGGIACGRDAAGACEGTFEELWSTVVVARPEAGWKFAGWKRDRSARSIAPSADQTDSTVYTAVFERDTEVNVATRR